MFTLSFTEEACQDVRLVGGKSVGLSEMVMAGLPVAPGFSVTTAAYRRFIEFHDLGKLIDATLSGLDLSDGEAVEKAALTLGGYMETLALPPDVALSIENAYQSLCQTTGVADLSVAVRSSATAEDSVEASFAGEFETWVDIVGVKNVLAYVQRCYVSIYVARVLSYFGHHDIDPRLVEMSVVIQKTVRARTAGVMFTLSPVTGDRSKIVIEASWGLGLSVVGGEVTPDRFMIEKIGLNISERVAAYKHIEYRRGDAQVEVPEERRLQLCLNDEELISLAKLGKKLEAKHGTPQDIEFAVDEELPVGSNLILLQCRPETIWSSKKRVPAFDSTKGVTSWITSSISNNRK